MPRQESIAKRIDWVVVSLYAALVIFGWLNIYSASSGGDDVSIFNSAINSGKQFRWMVISGLLAFAITLIEARFFVTLSYVLYVLILLFVVSVFFVGTEIKGQNNWIKFGGFQMQPSELAKFGTALGLSKFLAGLNVDIRKWADKLKAFLIVIFPMAMVAAQGDLGSALVFFGFVLAMHRVGLESYFLIVGTALVTLAILALVVNKYYLIATMFLLMLLFGYLFWKNKKLITLTFLIWVAASAFVYSVDYGFSKLKKHRQDRINVLLGKEVEKGRDWNIRQSIIAIGSGGFLGKGYLNGTQTKLKFVPEQSTDFIFSSVGEEFGFVGSTLLIAAYLVLFYRLLYLAERQRSVYSKVYGYCVVSVLFFHFMINIGMTIGLMPVVGIPLPFISYGGSSLLAFTLMLFVFLRLDIQRYETMR
ncbi:MAG: M50 family metallopeptidase [Chitinophagales bacterium]|nr:M50 family metallopeptidase [Chitinophagales bacterium]MDW8419109.1 M50 family metallopeptidase [Chitinophagales bacterium]